MFKKLLVFLAAALFFLSADFTPSVWAQNQNYSSQTFYQADYTILPDATCQAGINITLKNKIADVYVSSYSLTIGSNNVFDVQVKDNFGDLAPQVEKQENRTKITVDFPKKVIGKDNSNTLKISYRTPDFSRINGEILEVSIPGVIRKEDLEDYQVTLNIPAGFGQASFIQPKPNSESKQNDYLVYKFDKNSLLKFQGISAAFGEMQVFDFDFYYQLKNPSGKKVLTEISLPADTPYQQVFYQKLSPKPKEIRIDQDNNWLAVYELEKNQELEIQASGSTEIYIRQKPELNYPALTPEQISRYLQPQPYWETDNEDLLKLAGSLLTVEDIYRFVTDNLIYDYGRLNAATARLGAASILKNTSTALCTEFTDLFIALCRANGIPAREVNGYAFTDNPQLRPLSLSTDVLHAWPQYYDINKNLWIDVDPTWENTTGGIDFFNKLDLSHFSFVRHGLNSSYPPPPGAFSYGEPKKNVFVEFGKRKERFFQIEFTPQLPQRVVSGLPIRGKITLTNTGQGAYHQQTLVVTANSWEKKEELAVLPPFAEYTTEINLPTKWNTSQEQILTITFGGQQATYPVRVIPAHQYLWEQLKLWLNKYLRF